MSLSPVATEILFALDEGEHVVGVTKFCDYPKEALTKPVLCDFAEINYETILQAKVDLVVLQDMHQQATEDLDALGIKYVVVRQNCIKDILDGILTLGCICNKEKRAKAIVDKIQREIVTIKKKVHKGKTKSVLLCVSRDVNEETIYNFYAAGSNVFYNELLEIVGGKNALCEAPVQYPLMTIDALMALKPDVVFDLLGEVKTEKKFNNQAMFNLEHIKKIWGKSMINNNINIRIVPFLGTKFLRPGPRIVEILRAMNQALGSN
ncbi:MAG: ABC transporter substrate-binding protein [Synergistaceae bacterium]|nr:ABC transporter substrate-binding protein [Synergistaceae bacterium]